MIEVLERTRPSSRISANFTPRPRRQSAIDLLLFAIDPALVREATDAGVDGFIVDWERREKLRRQAGEGTQINHDTAADLRRVRVATDAPVICRINAFGRWTAREVDRAIACGADEVLLPMVRSGSEVIATAEFVGDRCGLGILVETERAVRAAKQLASIPLSRVYVGLNDLRIDRGSTSLFEPLIDGTVERLRSTFGSTPFGVAGLTLPERGEPIPSSLLAAELVRLDASFTFLRRSFLSDTAARPLAPAVAAMREHLDLLSGVPARRLATDHIALSLLVGAQTRTA